MYNIFLKWLTQWVPSQFFLHYHVYPKKTRRFLWLPSWHETPLHALFQNGQRGDVVPSGAQACGDDSRAAKWAGQDGGPQEGREWWGRPVGRTEVAGGLVSFVLFCVFSSKNSFFWLDGSTGLYTWIFARVIIMCVCVWFSMVVSFWCFSLLYCIVSGHGHAW